MLFVSPSLSHRAAARRRTVSCGAERRKTYSLRRHGCYVTSCVQACMREWPCVRVLRARCGVDASRRRFQCSMRALVVRGPSPSSIEGDQPAGAWQVGVRALPLHSSACAGPQRSRRRSRVRLGSRGVPRRGTQAPTAVLHKVVPSVVSAHLAPDRVALLDA